jgi:hypothetical protein
MACPSVQQIYKTAPALLTLHMYENELMTPRALLNIVCVQRRQFSVSGFKSTYFVNIHQDVRNVRNQTTLSHSKKNNQFNLTAQFSQNISQITKQLVAPPWEGGRDPHFVNHWLTWPCPLFIVTCWLNVCNAVVGEFMRSRAPYLQGQARYHKACP